ncbi:hypothetical protein KY285_017502 [Solanum tuberosum]|nr:hypothetical protein KY285_017502 [Solanum tuberosum]
MMFDVFTSSIYLAFISDFPARRPQTGMGMEVGEVPGFLSASASAASLIIELMVFVKLAVINILLVQGKLRTAWLQIVVFCIHSELSNLESNLRSYFSLGGQCHRAAEKCSFGHHV